MVTSLIKTTLLPSVLSLSYGWSSLMFSGVPWTLHSWIRTLLTAQLGGLTNILDELLQVRWWWWWWWWWALISMMMLMIDHITFSTQTFSGFFQGMDRGEFSLFHGWMSSCPLLHIQVHTHFVILSPISKTDLCRTNKSEGTTLFLADVLSACYGEINTNTIMIHDSSYLNLLTIPTRSSFLVQLKCLRYGRHWQDCLHRTDSRPQGRTKVFISFLFCKFSFLSDRLMSLWFHQDWSKVCEQSRVERHSGETDHKFRQNCIFIKIFSKL